MYYLGRLYLSSKAALGNSDSIIQYNTTQVKIYDVAIAKTSTK